MKIKQNFMLRQLGTQYIAVPLGEELQDFKGMIKFNETAAKMWDFLKEAERSQEELAAFLVDTYGISLDEANEDSQAFVTTLKDNGLLSDD